VRAAESAGSKSVPKSVQRVNSMMAIIIDPSVAEINGPGEGLAAEIDEVRRQV
jgi:hypothetical protein